MQDCWTVVAEFCDIKERGRLYVVLKPSHTYWDDLICHYFDQLVSFATFRGCIEGDWHCMEPFCRLQKMYSRYRTLRLPSGYPRQCWSPWCQPSALCLNASYIRVCFQTYDPNGNPQHLHFMKWIHRLSPNRERFHPNNIMAWTSLRPTYQTRCHNGSYTPQQLQHTREFRVRLFLYDRGCGYPTLRIQSFEYSDVRKSYEYSPCNL